MNPFLTGTLKNESAFTILWSQIEGMSAKDAGTEILMKSGFIVFTDMDYNALTEMWGNYITKVAQNEALKVAQNRRREK